MTKFLTYDRRTRSIEKWEAINHFNMLHVEHNNMYHYCDICNKQYKTDAGLDKHIWEKHHERIHNLMFHPENY